MPLFELMRENTKVILWITVIAFVGLIFLAWGADFTTRLRGGQREPGVLARVNGERVLAREYAEAYEEARLLYEQQTGNRPDEESEMMLRTSTWDQLIERTLLRQAIEREGIIVTEDEVRNALVQNPPRRFLLSPSFQTDGQFDIRLYQQWITDPRTNTLPLEREQREMLEQAKLQLLLLAGVKVSPGEIRASWLSQNETCDLAYIQIPYHRVQVDEEVSDATLEDYLTAHADDFRLSERAALEYVKLEKKLSAEDSLEAYGDIADAMEELQRGEDFGVLVQVYSEAPPSRQGGETGAYMRREQFSRPIVAETAFSLEVGETSEILVSDDGFHILKLEDRRTEEEVEQVKIAEIFVPRRMSYETNFAWRDRMMEFADSARVSGFAHAVDVLGMVSSATGLFDPQSFIPGLHRLTAAKEFAQKAEVGEISRPIETIDTWYVLHLSERQPPREATLEEVRSRVRAVYLLEQRKQIATERAAGLLARCQEGLDLSAAAELDTLAVHNTSEGVSRTGFVRGIGQEPQVTAAAFAADGVGLIPFVITGSQGAFVLEVTARPAIDETAFESEREQLAARLLRERQTRTISEWVREQREAAEIDDYRMVLVSI